MRPPRPTLPYSTDKSKTHRPAFALHTVLVGGPLELLTVKRLLRGCNSASAEQTAGVIQILSVLKHSVLTKNAPQKIQSGLPVKAASPLQEAFERQIWKAV